MRSSDVLRELRAAGAAGVSGEVLARRFGVSRVAIAKHVAALRASGYRIDAAPGRGYRLAHAPDLPVPEEVRPLLSSALWTRLEGGGATGSTNDDAKALARAGAAEGTAVLASEQTAGRGRLGRAWVSPLGGVYLSVLLRPAVSPAEVPPLALVVALGVARGLEDLGARVVLKWPNDVLCAEGAPPDALGGKLAGVLLETAAEADRVDWVVAGIGANVRVPAERLPGAAYLDEVAGQRVALPRAAAAILDGVAGAYAGFCGSGFAALRDDYAAHSALIGRDVVVSDATGGRLGEGTVEGIDEKGRLVLDGPGGRVTVIAGDVTLGGREGP